MRSRNHICIAFLAVCAVMLMGMGGFGDSDVVNKIPKPDRTFSVRIIDSENVSYDVDEFSVDGLTYAPASVGKAEVGIDFANIKQVKLYREGENDVRADVGFKDGSHQQVHMAPGVQFYGRTSWGLMRLAAKDIREIDFK